MGAYSACVARNDKVYGPVYSSFLAIHFPTLFLRGAVVKLPHVS